MQIVPSSTWRYRLRRSASSMGMNLLSESATHEFGIEDLRRHDLASFHEAILVRPVIGDGPMDRSEMIPDQDVALCPRVDVAVGVLELVSEEEFQHRVAVTLGEIVDADGVAGIRVEHFPSRDRMGHED